MKARTKRQESKCIAGNDFCCDYSVNVKLPHEDQNDNLNGRLNYTSRQFPTYNKTLQYQSSSVQNKSLKSWFNHFLKNSNIFKMAKLIVQEV